MVLDEVKLKEITKTIIKKVLEHDKQHGGAMLLGGVKNVGGAMLGGSELSKTKIKKLGLGKKVPKNQSNFEIIKDSDISIGSGKKKALPSAFIEFRKIVDSVRAKNPDISYKQALIKAKSLYHK